MSPNGTEIKLPEMANYSKIDSPSKSGSSIANQKNFTDDNGL